MHFHEALPGSGGHTVSHRLCFKSEKKCIQLTTVVHNFLDNFWWMVGTLHTPPTCIYEVVPSSQVTVGFTDASGLGMGGTHFIPTSWLMPHQPNNCPNWWLQPHNQWMKDTLLTFNNPQGMITNSELELMGTVAHHDMIATHHSVIELTIGMAHNNCTTIIWNQKGSTSTVDPPACLLRLKSLHTHHHHHMLSHHFIPQHLN